MAGIYNAQDTMVLFDIYLNGDLATNWQCLKRIEEKIEDSLFENFGVQSYQREIRWKKSPDFDIVGACCGTEKIEDFPKNLIDPFGSAIQIDQSGKPIEII